MAATGKRVGRPRKNAQHPDGDPRQQILTVAAKLFQAKGFAATTTREIATGSGLQQGSLFHYFPSKSAILSELLGRATEPALSFTAMLEDLEASPAQRLCLLAYFDTLAICASPYNEVALMFLPEVPAPPFEPYWRKRLDLLAVYEKYVLDAIRDGTFIHQGADRLNEFVCALVESSVWWFRRGEDDPVEAAELVATNVLRLCLADPSGAADVVRATLAQFGEQLPPVPDVI